jgi:hypothetical protein
MRNLLDGLERLSRPQKLAITLMTVLIVVTWLAVCLVLASYWMF